MCCFRCGKCCLRPSRRACINLRLLLFCKKIDTPGRIFVVVSFINGCCPFRPQPLQTRSLLGASGKYGGCWRGECRTEEESVPPSENHAPRLRKAFFLPRAFPFTSNYSFCVWRYESTIAAVLLCGRHPPVCFFGGFWAAYLQTRTYLSYHGYSVHVNFRPGPGCVQH